MSECFCGDWLTLDLCDRWIVANTLTKWAVGYGPARPCYRVSGCTTSPPGTICS